MTHKRIFVSARQTKAIVFIRAAAIAAAAVSAYLFYEAAVAGSHAIGCGPAGGCAQVLSSRWSHWFGIPVSAPGSLLYLGIFLASFTIVPGIGERRPRLGRTVFTALVLAAASGAAWFASLQIFALKAVCPWCMTIHACGLTIAILAAWPSAQRGDAFALSGAALAGGAGLAGLLILGQVLSPTPGPSVERLSTGVGGGAAVGAVHLELNGRPIDLDIARFPRLGPPNAPFLLVLLADYTCPHCRATHPVIEAARKRYGPRLTVIVLPVPLNPQCNPLAESSDGENEHACELARLALSVWIAKPESFDALDDWLFQSPGPRSPREARDWAVSLVGAAALARAEADPAVSQILHASVKVYEQLGGGAIPKVIVGNDVLSGQISSSDSFYYVIEKDLGVKPAL